MSDFPDPSIDYQSQSGDSEFQNMYVTGKLNYRFKLYKKYLNKLIKS